jgi:shikimate dehydrogenase
VADTAEPRLLALVGDPVAHSLSPAMHNAAIAALGLNAVYVALRTTYAAFPGLVREILAAGGGLNVTAPFKDDAWRLTGSHTPAAARTHAVNTIWGSPDHPSLDNTDVEGIRDAARVLMQGHTPHRVRVYGTGGAARAAAAACNEEWPQAVVRPVARTGERAEGFARWAAAAGIRCTIESPGPDEREELVINATPVRDRLPDFAGDGFPSPDDDPAPPFAFLDLNYRAGQTPMVLRYRHHGVNAEDGRAVLVGQGAAAFERFFNVRAPLAVMRAAVEDALRA